MLNFISGWTWISEKNIFIGNGSTRMLISLSTKSTIKTKDMAPSLVSEQHVKKRVPPFLLLFQEFLELSRLHQPQGIQPKICVC